MCGGGYAVITFLNDFNKIECVDSEFLPLVKSIHKIPSCATFGVSCAGHFDDVGSYKDCPDQFYPSPYGDLDIIVLRNVPHVENLLKILEDEIKKDTDSSFQKIYHPFGPKKDSETLVEVWEIRTGDNKSLPEDYNGEWLYKEKNGEVYEKSKKRAEESRRDPIVLEKSWRCC